MVGTMRASTLLRAFTALASCGGDGHPIKITMRVPALPEDLSNGDVYSLRLEAGGVPFLDVSGAAKYSESLPNGATCDGVPCRFAKLTP
jgi:hypothetical protein